MGVVSTSAAVTSIERLVNATVIVRVTAVARASQRRVDEMIAITGQADRAIDPPRSWRTATLVRALQIAACVTIVASSLQVLAVESAHPLSAHESEYLSLLNEAQFDELRRKASMGIANGDPVAKAFLAQLYFRGLGVPANKNRAVSLLEECASQGNPVCKTFLGRAIATGNDDPEVRKRTVKLVSEAAETGHPFAVLDLGRLYEFGIGVEKNYELAFKYYELARGAGLQSATAHLGWLYRQGKGVSRNEGMAKSLFREAAKAGSPSGMVGHAFSYMNEGKPAKALKFLDVPIKLKYSDAQALAGHIWVFGGKKVHRNYARGMRLLHEAAEKDHKYALRDLGKIYERGIGVPASRRLAADWYYKGGIAAAKRDDRELSISCLEDLERVGGGSSMVADLRSKIPGGVEVPAPGNEEAVAASSGTGWVSPEGFIITANHVVAGHQRVAVLLSSGKEVNAKVVVSDSANDIALLAIDNPISLPPGLPIAGKSAAIGARVWTIGFPLTHYMGDSQKLTDGVVSSVTGYKNDPRHKTDQVGIKTAKNSIPVYRGAQKNVRYRHRSKGC